MGGEGPCLPRCNCGCVQTAGYAIRFTERGTGSNGERVPRQPALVGCSRGVLTTSFPNRGCLPGDWQTGEGRRQEGQTEGKTYSLVPRVGEEDGQKRHGERRIACMSGGVGLAGGEECMYVHLGRAPATQCSPSPDLPLGG